MKKLLALLALSFAASAFAATPPPTRTVLSTSTEDGITTTKYVGRVQGDPSDDGTLTLTVFPLTVITTATGKQLGDAKLDTSASFTITLSAAQYAGLSTLVQAAFAAKVAAATASATP